MIEKTLEPSVTSTGSTFRAQIFSLVALAIVLGVLPFPEASAAEPRARFFAISRRSRPSSLRPAADG